jgi:hypothetical protein
MGVPTSEVGYTSATTRRETMKSKMDMWWHWMIKKKKSPGVIAEKTKQMLCLFQQYVGQNFIGS